MIFDSQRMQSIREQYVSIPDHRAPMLVVLDRSDTLSGERAYLESIIQSVSETVQRDWMARFLSTDHTQHKAVWFQMMLLPWLQQIGQVTPEPVLHANHPDFLVQTSKQTIVIEARAVLTGAEETEQSNRDHDMIAMLRQIQRPFAVCIEELVINGDLQINELQRAVTEWLDTQPKTQFQFEDKHNNLIVLSSHYSSSLPNVGVLGPTRTRAMDAGLLRSPLREKARQHKAIRSQGYPYVIALFLEPWHLNAEGVTEAWFGREQVIINTDTFEVIEQRVDKSGVHYLGSDIRHRTVSGTLVFRSTYEPELWRHQLRGWYIQNPYAKQPLDTGLFPVESKFVVVGKTATALQMEWRK